MPLKVFLEYHIKDFYTPTQLVEFKQRFNIDQYSLDMALMKRSLLTRIVRQQYYAIFFPKEFPNRFRKKRIKYLRRKPKKKNLKLRIKFFYSIPQDNFLFYLSILDKQLLIKPFNFLNCLFFFKMRKFKKVYVVRKRRRLRFRFYYRFGRRRKKRRRISRRRIRYLRYRLYRFRKRFLIKRFRRIKIRKYKNFLRFIAFFNTCKKITLNIDDNFKVNSLLNLPYKLLRFNFNKMTNSYNFFLHFNNQRKSKITLGSINTKNILIQKKTELYNIIKSKLKNRFYNLNNHSFETLNLDFVKQNPNLKFQMNDYLNYNNVIKNSLVKNYQVNFLKNNFNNSQQNKQVFFVLNLIHKISKKILFFEQKRITFKLKEKKKLYLLFLKIFNSNKKKCMKLFKNYQQILNNLFDIISKLKNKLKELIVTFYIVYFNTINNLNLLKKKKSKFLKKVLYFLKKKKLKNKQKLKTKKKLVFAFYENKKKIFFYKSKKIYFSYTNKLNNTYSYGIIKRWKLRKFKRRKIKARKLLNFRSIKKKFVLTNFFLYKNYNSYFDKKNCKDIYLNFLKKSNVQHLIDLQKTKNINFLK